MSRLLSRTRDDCRAASLKYGLIVAVLSAATLTVVLAIAERFSGLPPGLHG